MTELDQTQEHQRIDLARQQPIIPVRRNSRARQIAAGLVLTGIVALGGVFIWGNTKDSDQDTTPNNDTDTNPGLDNNPLPTKTDVANLIQGSTSNPTSTEEILATLVPNNTQLPETQTSEISLPMEGEVPSNALRAENSGIEGAEVWQIMLQNLIYNGSGAIDQTNALDTSVRNPVDFVNLYGPVIASEPGLGHSLESISLYQQAFTGFERLDDVRGTDLLNDQGGILAGGFYERADNRDYSIFKAAWAILSAQDSRFAEMTELEVLTNQEAIARLIPIKERILSLTQEKSLAFSHSEIERRDSVLMSGDPSNLLVEELQESGQWVSCDVLLPTEEAETREDQLEQDTRTVTHKEWNKYTHTQANSEDEWILYAVSINASNPDEWTVKAFTDRGHTFRTNSATWQVTSASGEQLLPCGEEETMPSLPTPTTTPAAPAPTATTSASPTYVVYTPTAGATSTESEEDTPTVVIETSTPENGKTPTDLPTQPGVTSTTAASTPTAVVATRTPEANPTDFPTQPAPEATDDEDPTDEPTEESSSDAVLYESGQTGNNVETIISDADGNEYRITESKLTGKVNFSKVN